MPTRRERTARIAPGDDNDIALAARAAAGDAAAFGVLVARHEAKLRSFLGHLAGRDAADDLAQDAFLRAWDAIGRFRGEARFGSWLCAIGWRCFLDRRRRDASERRAHEAVPPPQSPAADADPDRALDLARALAVLTDRERAVLILIDGHGWSYDEATRLLAMPLGTVKGILVRARERCRAMLEGAGHDV